SESNGCEGGVAPFARQSGGAQRRERGADIKDRPRQKDEPKARAQKRREAPHGRRRAEEEGDPRRQAPPTDRPQEQRPRRRPREVELDLGRANGHPRHGDEADRKERRLLQLAVAAGALDLPEDAGVTILTEEEDGRRENDAEKEKVADGARNESNRRR